MYFILGFLIGSFLIILSIVLWVFLVVFLNKKTNFFKSIYGDSLLYELCIGLCWTWPTMVFVIVVLYLSQLIKNWANKIIK